MAGKRRTRIDRVADAQLGSLPSPTRNWVMMALNALEVDPNVSFAFVYELTQKYAGIKVLEGPGFKLYWKVQKDARGDYARVLRVEPTDYFNNPGDYLWMEIVSRLDQARYAIVMRGYFIARGIRAFRIRPPKSFRKRRP